MPSSSHRVWLIDKNEPWRVEAERALHRSGFMVESGDDILALPAFGKPDLVILGCLRPGKRETQTLHHFVEQSVPVMVLASRISESEIRNLFHAGATDASARPGSWEKLQQLVRRSLETLFRRAHRTEKVFTAPTL